MGCVCKDFSLKNDDFTSHEGHQSTFDRFDKKSVLIKLYLINLYILKSPGLFRISGKLDKSMSNSLVSRGRGITIS